MSPHARWRSLLDHRGPPGLAYLAHALYALVPVLTEEVETMTVDEHWRVYVHPGWLTASDVRTMICRLLWA